MWQARAESGAGRRRGRGGVVAWVVAGVVFAWVVAWVVAGVVFAWVVALVVAVM